MMGATSGEGTPYPSRAHSSHPIFKFIYSVLRGGGVASFFLLDIELPVRSVRPEQHL